MLQPSPMRIHLNAIMVKAEHRPRGYVNDCLTHGKVDGPWIEFDDEAWRFLCRKYRVLDLTRADLDENYAEATKPAAARGFEILPEEGYRARRRICDQCEHSKAEECAVCGTNPVRLYWRHARCPHVKW